MCVSRSKPKTPDPLPTAPPPIQMQDAAAQQAADDERKRRRRASGYQSTILAGDYSPMGGASGTGLKSALGD